ncbi:hypothetical protein, partial [Candidatus Binatus sp.]|uniref:hypothetical protein n=1 Tax=Candidatus Binatus sp. TaxID=2811406 RepID=UPI003C950410
MNATRAASPFVALGAIAAGNAQVTASNNASSHIPTAFMGFNFISNFRSERTSSRIYVARRVASSISEA